ncbi:MAG: ribosome maturation factor RimM [Bacteroidales bacterium]|jgi:16S rRNA processing protein RimM|nr:ribosome maturation factor RimM [Bacteroidales bacterium]MDD3724817.1 ribosome maturation factor RimM [Bacteroidales bacterium]MDD4544929.1 ribosome maturation factor RimM [Bacteroidales bacterium]MDY0053632.1 ribosome maturation factor RimM [Bacteroidales bacterium]
MEIKDCFYLGKVSKPFGFKGELVLFFDVDTPEEYSELDGVYIEINKRLVLYPIETIRVRSNKATVRFRDISPEDALKLIGKDLYLPLELLPILEGNKFYYHEIIGFEVIDAEKGNIGVIKKVLEYPATPLFSIDFKGKEILMPIIDSVIENVDRETKTIYINAPKGLIELYIG